MKIYLPFSCYASFGRISEPIYPEIKFSRRRISLRKKIVTTHLVAIFLFFANLQLSFAATGNAQVAVSFSGKDVSLEQVFASVKKQTGYTFVYYTDVLQGAHRVTLDVRELPLDQFLDVCLKDQPLTYKVIGQTVMIAKKEVKTSVVGDVEDPAGSVIKGRVTNEKGEPLAGASVVVKGSRRGTMTGSDGRFVLKGATVGVTLVVSYAGFTPREITVQNISDVSLTLQHSNNPLDEAKVIAYGTTTQRLSTGDVTTVNSVDIERQPVDNPLLALEGRVPGLLVTQATGLPGSGIAVQLRGVSSIANGNDPLYVIDGVPYVSELLPNLGTMLGTSGTNNTVQNGNPLSFINPSDIESISVLKDAAATAIYGSRAATGAILITTKKGKAGQTRVNLNLQDGWGQVAKKLDLMNDQQYLQMRHEAIANDGLVTGVADYDINGTYDTTRYTDWQKVLIGNTAQYNNLSADVSGGNSSTQYLIGATYHRETTVFPGTFSDQKASIHFNINSISPNQKFKIQFSGNYLLDNNQLPQSDLTATAIRLVPDAPPLYSSAGVLNWAPNSSGSSTWQNPLASDYNMYTNKTNNLVANAVLTYEILKGLDVISNFGYTNLQSNETDIFPLSSYPPENRPTSVNFSIFGNNNIHSWIVEPQLRYRQSIGNGKLEFLTGTTINQRISNGIQLDGVGFTSTALINDIHSAANIYSGPSTDNIYKYDAVFGRLDYNWEDKYILDLTARRDGSSRFGSANQFSNFGAVGASWIFSQEEFFKNMLPVLSFGKLRASYGTTGNDQIGDYQFLNLYNPTSVGVPYQGSTGLAPVGLTNPYLQWEETKKMEFGLELGFIKDRFLLNVNRSVNRSSNELLGYALPTITGFQSIERNFPATVQNSSWEFSANTINIKTKNFRWTTSLNLTIPRNKLVAFANLATSGYYSNTLVIGRSINIIKTFRYLGVDPQTGLYTYADSHGNSTTNPQYGTDNTTIIDPTPVYYGGIGNSLSYKNIQIDFLFQFTQEKASNYYYGNAPGAFGGGLGNEPVSVGHRWQQPGNIASIQKYNSDYSLNAGLIYSSDAVWKPAGYTRLKNLSLSWQLPDNMKKKACLQIARIYIQGQNLLTFTHYLGLDPETKSSTTLPPLRVITIGAQIEL